MKMELTALIISQAKTFAVMLAAGILTESLWQIKRRMQGRIGEPGAVRGAARILWFLEEAAFWIAAAAALSGFLYYCDYGKISLHAAVGFFIGLLLWKKVFRYVIMNAKV